ncbi:hypothetical protein H2204_009995 [Knufia peltigerae]|uniref:Major facilitator superfamily (MFS) profile domain-containing protein n=1 Tax=Knufia peltigerae TaxID=1002370 RepID=A0AA39CT89_9EURO|nr:hypothetical protein H2204_009995 [Knufia peltigerae]
MASPPNENKYELGNTPAVKEDSQTAYHIDITNAPDTIGDWDEAEERKLIRKIDFRIIPFLSVVYGLSLLDRSNISAAYIAGMDEALDLTVGARYNIALMMFFATYTLLELPSNLIIRRLGARNWICFLIIGFGSMVLGMGFVKDWASLTVLRMFLGAFEAGILPGALFLISSWYKTFETAKRFTIFYMSALLTNGFNGIIAYALSLIHVGDGAYKEGWRWIFIIEGAVTIACGFFVPFFLGEFPEKSIWLNDRERHIAKRRLTFEVGGHSYEKEPLLKSLRALLDWKIAFYCFQLYVAAASVYALAYFMPVILLKDLGFSYTKAQLLTSPPYLSTVILSIISAWLSDRTKLRWPFLCTQAVISILGLLLMLYVQSPAGRYFGTFLGVFGTQANTPGSLSYGSNQIGDPRKKGVVVAAMVSCASLGGITGSTVFRRQDAPRYIPGMW